MKKLSQQELDELLQVKSEYDMEMYKLGLLTFDIEELENRLSEMRDSKREFLMELNKIKEREKNLAIILESKYGSGKISLETGEIS